MENAKLGEFVIDRIIQEMIVEADAEVGGVIVWREEAAEKMGQIIREAFRLVEENKDTK